jgi:hypothetical protein
MPASSRMLSPDIAGHENARRMVGALTLKASSGPVITDGAVVGAMSTCLRPRAPSRPLLRPRAHEPRRPRRTPRSRPRSCAGSPTNGASPSRGRPRARKPAARSTGSSPARRTPGSSGRLTSAPSSATWPSARWTPPPFAPSRSRATAPPRPGRAARDERPRGRHAGAPRRLPHAGRAVGVALGVQPGHRPLPAGRRLQQTVAGDLDPRIVDDELDSVDEVEALVRDYLPRARCKARPLATP